MEKRIWCELHISTLTTYLEASIVPRGFRIVIKPATASMSGSEVVAWNEVLSRASFDLVRIVIRQYETSLKAIHNQESQLLSHKLAIHECALLAAYQRKKSDEVYAAKSQKLARDKVITPHTPPMRHTTDISSQSNNSRPLGDPLSSDNIVNLSSYELSADEISLSSQGLNFCPVTGGFSESKPMKDLDTFAKNLRLREYFLDKSPANVPTSILPCYKYWTPPTQRAKCLDLYIAAVQRDVLHIYRKQVPFKRNLSINETAAMQQRKGRGDIIIK